MSAKHYLAGSIILAGSIVLFGALKTVPAENGESAVMKTGDITAQAVQASFRKEVENDDYTIGKALFSTLSKQAESPVRVSGLIPYYLIKVDNKSILLITECTPSEVEEGILDQGQLKGAFRLALERKRTLPSASKVSDTLPGIIIDVDEGAIGLPR